MKNKSFESIAKQFTKMCKELDNIKNDLKEFKQNKNISLEIFLKEKRLKLLYRAKTTLLFVSHGKKIDKYNESQYKTFKTVLEEYTEFDTFDLSKYKTTAELFNAILIEINELENYFSKKTDDEYYKDNEYEDDEYEDDEYKVEIDKHRIYRITLTEEELEYLYISIERDKNFSYRTELSRVPSCMKKLYDKIKLLHQQKEENEKRRIVNMSILSNLKNCKKNDVIINKLMEDISRYKNYFETMYDILCPLFDESSTWNNVKDYSISENKISLTIGVQDSIEFICNAMFGCSNDCIDGSKKVALDPNNPIFVFSDFLKIIYIDKTTIKIILSDKNEKHNLFYNLVETKDSHIEMSIIIGICSRLNDITKNYHSFVEGYISVEKELRLRPSKIFYEYLQGEKEITPEMEK